VEHGNAVGVETSDGAVYRARHFVVSGLNPQQTFLELIDENLLPEEWRQKARQFKYNLIGPLFALCVDLQEPPYYKQPCRTGNWRTRSWSFWGSKTLRSFRKWYDITKRALSRPR
jgi:hypothetical protein